MALRELPVGRAKPKAERRKPRRSSGRAAPAATGGRRRQDLAFLLSVSQELAGSLALGDVLSTVSRHLLDAVPAWRAGVLLLEPDGRHLRLAAGSIGEGGRELPRGRLLDLARYPEVREAITTRRPVHVADVRADPRLGGVREWLGDCGVSSLFVVPLLVQESCLGVLSIAQRSGDKPWTAHERTLIQAVANQAAVAVHNAQLFGELQAAARSLEKKVEERTRRLEESHLRLSVLNEINGAINMSLDLDRILEAALANLQRLRGVERAHLYLRAGPEDFDAYRLDARGALERKRLPLPRPDAPGGDALLALDGNPAEFGDAAPAGPGVLAHLLAPLVSKDGVVGAVQVFSSAGQAAAAADLELLQQVAGEISLALERNELYRAAQRRSTQFEVISDIGRRLTGAVAIEDLHPMAADLIRRSFGYSVVVVMTLDAERGELRTSGVSAEDPAVETGLAGHRQPADAGLCGRALSSGEPVLVADVRREPRFLPHERLATRSELVVPLRGNGETLGVIDLQDGRPDAFTSNDVAVVRTVADQLAAALHLSSLFEDLHRGREFTERVINNLTGGLVVTDRRGIVQVVNQRAAEMLRVDRWDLLGHDLLAVFPTAEPLFRFAPDEVSRECRIELRDGSTIPVGFSNAFFVDTRDNRDAVIITFRDLSDLRELRRKVQHAERLATVGTVAAGVAHEIRNPLFGISATAQVIARELPAGSPLLELCEGMLSETRRLNALVENLVSYSRPPALHLTPADPCRLWDEAIQQGRARADAAGARVVHTCRPSGRSIEVDADQLKQVMLNLLLNALEAAPGGEVLVGVDWDEGGDGVTAWIEDEGPGLTRDQADRVFDLFYTTKLGGSGMGLAISGKIVEDHGGRISVTATPGHGARFEVRLPGNPEGSRGSARGSTTS